MDVLPALIVAFPLAGFVLLSAGRGRLPARAVAVIGAGSVGIAALLTLLLTGLFLAHPPEGYAFREVIWHWITVGGLHTDVGLYLDPLSLLMTLVITVVGFLIHFYSTEYMAGDEGYCRYFAYMNLFVAAMLVLVLADNLVFLYLGWEGVGLCSYLLIGFWYTNPDFGRAARKAFIVTRVGDVAFALGLFVLFTQLGTLNIQALLTRASAQWASGSVLPVAAAALLLGGAVGKSAQLPLQTWLPDAMAGPTPVSALIHAATMVTAGVYLIARTHTLFELAPAVQAAVAIIGAVTLVLSSCSALVQRDIKRILAYSTISQIGYMFLALGVGAWTAAMFHFMTHAFFKALLFLAAGAVIHAQDEEHDIFRMGGLRRSLPEAFWPFVAGSAALAALPLVTAGFYSKDLILWQAWSSPHGSAWLWAAGLVGAALTALYISRCVFIAFFGESKTPVGRRPGIRIMVALVVLSVLSLAGGFIDMPDTLGGWSPLAGFLGHALPPGAAGHGPEALLQSVAALVAVGGVGAAWWLFGGERARAAGIAQSAPGRWIAAFWFGGWGFDTAYDWLLVRPFRALARLNRNDVVDSVYGGIALLARACHGLLTLTQSGSLRWYATAIGGGAALALAIVLWT